MTGPYTIHDNSLSSIAKRSRVGHVKQSFDVASIELVVEYCKVNRV